MLKSLLTMLKGPAKQVDQTHSVEVATAALLCEVVRADNDADARELATLKQLIRTHFNLSDEEVDKVVSDGETRSEEAVDLIQFTKALNEHMSAESKEKIMLGLWQIAYADQKINPNEEHIIRKIADLLYIPHSRYIKSKLTAQSAT